MLRRLTLAAALLAGSALSAQANNFRWANDGDVNSMDPYTRQETFLLAFGSNFYEPLVRRDREGKVEAALAESWTISDDGKTLTFKLRPGIKFHSGVNGFTPTRDLTAEDVIWSFDRQWKPDHPFAKVSGGSYDYFNDMSMPDLLESVAKGDDDLTVVIKLKKPNAPILANLAMDFATIHSAEYAKYLLDKGTPPLLTPAQMERIRAAAAAAAT